MKSILIYSLLFLLSGNTLFAHHKIILNDKDVDGIYTNFNDYKKGILSCRIEKQDKNKTIKLKQFFISPELLCIMPTGKAFFDKDSIFAVHLFNGDSYRFINHAPCYIADTTFLYIYEFETTRSEYKMYGPHRSEKIIPVTYYYFSFGNHKDCYQLTLGNLKRFPIIFSVISNNFDSNEMLYRTNPQSGHFKINDLLKTTIR
jgi:hypothetical protein